MLDCRAGTPNTLTDGRGLLEDLVDGMFARSGARALARGGLQSGARCVPEPLCTRPPRRSRPFLKYLDNVTFTVYCYMYAYTVVGWSWNTLSAYSMSATVVR